MHKSFLQQLYINYALKHFNMETTHLMNDYETNFQNDLWLTASLVWWMDNVLSQISRLLKSEHRPHTVISSVSAEKPCGLGSKFPDSWKSLSLLS